MNIKDDLYSILGVSKDASNEDIKKEYRKLAKELHPDRNKGDKISEEKFKKVSAAYDILGDPDKRKKYDLSKLMENNSNVGSNPFSFYKNADAFNGFFNFFRQNNSSSKNFIKHLNISLSVDIYTVAKGKKITLDLPIDECCENCKGSGVKKGTNETICSDCSGTGQKNTIVKGSMIFSTVCSKCSGLGKIYETCSSCIGSGVVSKNRNIEVQIPKGIRSGSSVCLRGVGNFSPGNQIRADINIKVNINEHKFFKIKNEDIHVCIPIKFKDMIIGTSITVPTLYGNVNVVVPPETVNSSTLRLSGLGLPIAINSDRNGDLFIHLLVDMPKGFSSYFKEKIIELDDSSAKYEMIDDYKNVFDEIQKERN